MHSHKILLSVAVIIFVVLATSCGNSKGKAEPEKRTGIYKRVETLRTKGDSGLY